MDIFKAATGTTTKSHLNNLKILQENLFQRASILVNTQLSLRILAELSEEKTVEPSYATACLQAFSVTDFQLLQSESQSLKCFEIVNNKVKRLLTTVYCLRLRTRCFYGRQYDYVKHIQFHLI